MERLISSGWLIEKDGEYSLVKPFIEGLREEQQEIPKSEEQQEIPESIEKLLRQRNEIDGKIRKDYKQRVTVMFTDIVGSTDYFAKKGDIAGRAMVQRHNDLLFPIIEGCNGKVIKTIGDAIMACFGKVDDGVQAVIKMQQALAEYNQNTDDEIHIRIGLHTGMAITEPKDIYGDTVNTAARIEALAWKDQILISGATKDELPKEEFNLHFHGEYALKGIPDLVPIYEVLWYEGQMPKKPKKEIKEDDSKIKQKIGVTNSQNVTIIQAGGNVIV